jgi:BirA family transcriptional regulator, biotin operon repressor / biotin---[acetyl-CoA-carboxylase] ligase
MMPREEWSFDTRRIGRRVLVFDEVDSTNSVAAQAWASGGSKPIDALPQNESGGLRPPLARVEPLDGLAIVAENQTAGRGRFGRAWRSQPGDSLLLSIILLPPPELRRPSILTAWAAVGVAEVVYSFTGRQASIKWPNDVLVRGQKVCGILIEQNAATIVGIGLNLNQSREQFDSAGLPLATSLAIVSGQKTMLRTAAETLLSHLDAEYTRLLEGERAAVEAEWKWRTGLLGRQVEVELTDGSRARGRLRELGFDTVELELPDNHTTSIIPERVEHIRLLAAGSDLLDE